MMTREIIHLPCHQGLAVAFDLELFQSPIMELDRISAVLSPSVNVFFHQIRMSRTFAIIIWGKEEAEISLS
jgi:hypothetical protein